MMTTRIVRKTRTVLVTTLLSTIVLTACQPGTETGGEAVTGRFAVEVIEVGVRYDEPVVVAGETAGSETTEATSVVLQRRGDDGSFSDTLAAADTSGNETETTIVVTVRSQPTGVPGGP